MHLAEIATTFASGTAHWRFGNVDWNVVSRLAVPGFIGAFIGAVALSSLSADAAEPIVAGILLALGVYVLVRFPAAAATRSRPGTLPAVFLAPLGLFAGAMDAMGGGGWGPIGTPTLLASGRMEPRKVIGSIDTSEFLVALGASAGFLSRSAPSRSTTPGSARCSSAASSPRRSPPGSSARCRAHVLGLSVGTLIIITNCTTLLETAGVSDDVTSVLFVVFGVAWLALLGVLLLKPRGQAVLQVLSPSPSRSRPSRRSGSSPVELRARA